MSGVRCSILHREQAESTVLACGAMCMSGIVVLLLSIAQLIYGIVPWGIACVGVVAQWFLCRMTCVGV